MRTRRPRFLAQRGEQKSAASRLAEYDAAFGPDRGIDWMRLGLSVYQAERLHGTPLGDRLAGLDPDDELDGEKVASILGVVSMRWSRFIAAGDAPSADRFRGGRQGDAGFWNAATLARWLGDRCPDASGKPRPDRLAAFGGAALAIAGAV